MLDSRSNNMLSGLHETSLGETGLHETKDREVVALGAAAGEDDLRGPASDQRGYRLAGTLHRRPGLLSMVMDGRGVAKMLPEIGLHGCQDLGQHGRGGVIVEIDAAHSYAIILRPIVGRDTGACWVDSG